MCNGFFIAASLFVFGHSYAQENQDYNHPTNNESAHLFDGYQDLNKGRVAVGDSLSVRAISVGVAKAMPQPATKNKPEEETLSFNILYFIFQRFKVSDVID